MADIEKLLEEIETELSSLKIRVKRIEEFILDAPDSKDYIRERINDEDELFDEAKNIVLGYDQASASLLQRRLSIGYSRAARILDQLEAAKIVGPAEGSKPRKVLKKN